MEDVAGRCRSPGLFCLNRPIYFPADDCRVIILDQIHGKLSRVLYNLFVDTVLRKGFLHLASARLSFVSLRTAFIAAISSLLNL